MGRVQGLATAVATAVVLVGSASPALASCAAPTLAVEPATAAPGDSVRLTGTGFQECNDTVINGQTPPPPEPSRNAPVVLEVAGTRLDLGTVDAVAGGTLDAQVTIPADAPSGEGTIQVDSSSPAAFTVAAAQPAPSPAPTDASDDELPNTGADATTAALLALVLLAAGAAVRRLSPRGPRG